MLFRSGKPSLVYVKNFSAESSKESVKNRDNDDFCGFKIACQDLAKLRCNKTKENDSEMSEINLFYSEESDGMSEYVYDEYLDCYVCPNDQVLAYRLKPSTEPMLHEGLHTEEDFQRIRDKKAAGEEPWISAYQLLVESQFS